jgi:hypothetical protein
MQEAVAAGVHIGGRLRRGLGVRQHRLNIVALENA